ncbi:hypothetical protein [Streptomyces sp. NPDC004658]|uniref:hypothetical protein n=1 Tax=Streptomyces sp. NPDC004658 TaxID=3154672 RepID=UPI0033A2CE2A
MAWDGQNGHPLFDTQVARRISTAPLVAGDAVYIAAFDPGRRVVLDPLSGRELWRKSAGGAYPARVGQDGRPEPVPFGFARPARPQIRRGYGSAQHRLRQRPRHTGSFPPGAARSSTACARSAG